MKPIPNPNPWPTCEDVAGKTCGKKNKDKMGRMTRSYYNSYVVPVRFLGGNLHTKYLIPGIFVRAPHMLLYMTSGTLQHPVSYTHLTLPTICSV